MLNNLSRTENIFLRKKNINTAIALSLNYWLMFKITGDNIFLHKAYHRAAASSKENFANIDLLLCRVFLLIERKEFNDAYELLVKLSPYKNYFKNSNRVYYQLFLYFNALIDIKIKSMKSAAKYFKSLEDVSDGDNNYLLPLLMGALKLEMREYNRASNYLYDSFVKGCRSPFLFVNLIAYFNTSNPLGQEVKLLSSFIKWAINHNADIKNIFSNYREAIISLMYGNSLFMQKIYSSYSEEWILRELIQGFINEADYSENAYKYFKEADSKQLTIKDLNIYLVKCACINRTYDIGRFTMEQFLAGLGTADLDNDLKAFVFHLILTNKKFKELSEVYSTEILKFCFFCLENEIHGQYYYSMYKFFLENAYAIERQELFNDVPKSYFIQAEKMLRGVLFTYEISPVNPLVKHIWIIEKEKRDLNHVAIENGKASISASSDFFNYVCFGNNAKTIIESKITLKKSVENADLGLYAYFFDKNETSLNLLIALARHYISLDKPSNESIKVLTLLLSKTGLSYSFKMQAGAALANFYYLKNNLQKALDCYQGIDENFLSDKYIEQMLLVFINAKQFDKAVKLIAKKSHCISDKTLFSSLKQICAFAEYRAYIANTAYELILKSWYDKVLLDTALKYYNGSQNDWQELSKALSNISVFEIELDEIIIRNSIWMHKLDAGTQHVYARMYENAPGNDMIVIFSYYCIYEVLINNTWLEYETISILESLFFGSKDGSYKELLAYGLSYLYFNYGISTLKSDEIINATVQIAEKTRLFFPIFKTSKDKKLGSAYIEQNQPFIYRCLPNKNVFLYYRVDDESEYRSKKMSYFRFGLYYVAVPHFYSEKITYYFSEELTTGSINTKESVVENNTIFVFDDSKSEESQSIENRFFFINNALVYEHMFKFDMVESIITDSLKEPRKIKGKIL